MHQPIIYSLCFLLLNSYAQLTAQSNSKDLRLLTPVELKQDFQLLRTGLEKTHAGLYTYTSKTALDKAFQEIEAGLNQPLSTIDFYRKITPLLKLIGNGHTNFIPPPDYNKAINTTLPRFPFAIYWHQDTLFVLRNLSNNEEIKAGTIIKSINGESAADIMQNLADNLTRDGYNESWPKGKIGRDFTGYYAFFKGTPAVFDLEIIDHKNQSKSLQIKGLTTVKMIQHSKKRYPNWRKPKGLPLQFDIKKGIGYLTVQSFSLPIIKKAKQKYKSFFKAAFQQLKTQKIQHLIIDIRDNGGGWPEVVNDLLSYLIDQPYENKTTAFTITKNLPNRKYYKDGLWDVLDMKKSLKLRKEGPIFRVTGGDKNNSISSAKNNFKGKIYVLANPFTFSGATDFMGMLKNVNRGIFIGETAGGSPHQVTAWIMPFLILPNSKIKAIIPVVHLKTKNNFPDDGLGIAPDFHVKNNIKDVLANRDKVRQLAHKLIQKEK